MIPVVLPDTPGGGSDIMGRDVMPKLTERFTGSGADVVADKTPAPFSQFVRVQIEKTARSFRLWE